VTHVVEIFLLRNCMFISSEDVCGQAHMHLWMCLNNVLSSYTVFIKFYINSLLEWSFFPVKIAVSQNVTFFLGELYQYFGWNRCHHLQSSHSFTQKMAAAGFYET